MSENLVAPLKTVTIPACQEHAGLNAISVTLLWECPRCGITRGEVFPAISYDGSRRLGCDGWRNPCGHIDYYADVRREAGVGSEGRRAAR